MADVHCLNCREPWDLHHMQHDLIKDVIMDHGLWPDLREDLLGPMYPDRDEKSRKTAAAAAKRATKKMSDRWYKPLKTGTLGNHKGVLAALERAGWLFLVGNVGRILRCSCCEEPYVPLKGATLTNLRTITTGHADDCYADDNIAMRLVASDPGRKDMMCWRDLQEDEQAETLKHAPPDSVARDTGPYAVVLTCGGEALGLPVPALNPVYFYRSGVAAAYHAGANQEGWRHWYVRDFHVVAMVGYQDVESLDAWRDTANAPREFDTFADFLSSQEALHG